MLSVTKYGAGSQCGMLGCWSFFSPVRFSILQWCCMMWQLSTCEFYLVHSSKSRDSENSSAALLLEALLQLRGEVGNVWMMFQWLRGRVQQDRAGLTTALLCIFLLLRISWPVEAVWYLCLKTHLVLSAGRCWHPPQLEHKIPQDAVVSARVQRTWCIKNMALPWPEVRKLKSKAT